MTRQNWATTGARYDGNSFRDAMLRAAVSLEIAKSNCPVDSLGDSDGLAGRVVVMW
jgi:hypothetical protein